MLHIYKLSLILAGLNKRYQYKQFRFHIIPSRLFMPYPILQQVIPLFCNDIVDIHIGKRSQERMPYRVELVLNINTEALRLTFFFNNSIRRTVI